MQYTGGGGVVGGWRGARPYLRDRRGDGRRPSRGRRVGGGVERSRMSTSRSGQARGELPPARYLYAREKTASRTRPRRGVRGSARAPASLGASLLFSSLGRASERTAREAVERSTERGCSPSQPGVRSRAAEGDGERRPRRSAARSAAGDPSPNAVRRLGARWERARPGRRKHTAGGCTTSYWASHRCESPASPLWFSLGGGPRVIVHVQAPTQHSHSSRLGKRHVRPRPQFAPNRRLQPRLTLF